ncbi:MAG TPA: DNA repair protein RecN [Gemmatimonadota bacterium]|nr:DNA repair protein RecN [Gemmatimonadota bacterium]
MLRRLHILEYALIDDVQVELGPGLNVLTGETGAGKSILVDSLALLLGARASGDAIREGAERAVVEGLFEVDGGEALVRREIHRDRTNRCYLDGGMATARMVQERTERWVELHGQHEDQLLLKRAAQRELLDAFAGSSGIADRVAALADRVAAAERESEELERAEAERTARIDYLRSQVDEIEAAALRAGEEEELEAEARLLVHGEERMRIAGEAYEAIEGADQALVSVLATLQRRLDRLAKLDPAVAGIAERLTGARLEIGDLARELAGYAEAVDHDPARLAATEERRELLFRLKRKHAAGTLEELIGTGESMAAELDRLERAAVRGTELAAERAALMAELSEAAGRLADAREAGADRLEAAVRERLAALGMGDGRLVVQLDRRSDPEGVEWSGERYAWSRAGIEEVAFLIAPNPGESARPLSQIASGGELSRVLLAIKSALAAVDRVPTLVFDEIDAGIGGVVAHHVARQLRVVAEHHQVVVVTHLAQIAAAADRHLLVEKSPVDGRTVTTVRVVAGDERVREVSRLLGGDPDRDVSRHHAEELLAGRP